MIIVISHHCLFIQQIFFCLLHTKVLSLPYLCPGSSLQNKTYLKQDYVTLVDNYLMKVNTETQCNSSKSGEKS